MPCAAGVQAIKMQLSMGDEISRNLADLEDAVRMLQENFPMLQFRQVGFIIGVTRQGGKFMKGWVSRVHELVLEAGLLVRNNLGRSILIKPPIVMESHIIPGALTHFADILDSCDRAWCSQSAVVLVYSSVTLTTLS